jgi:cell division protein ZapE
LANSLQSVQSRLDLEVAAQGLEFDAAQRDAAIRLDRLGAALRESSRSIGERLRARLPWLPVSSPRAPLRGLYLWGGVGRGKTMLMDWFYDSLSFSRRERTHFYRFMRQVHAELRTIKHEQPLEIVAERLAHKARVICLDEFFVADIADAMILAGLFEGLFRRGVTLVATSNSPPQDLYKDGLQRQRFLPAIDLIQNHVDLIHLDGGTDYRLRQLEQAPTYLDSALAGTTAQMKLRFAALAAGAASGPRVLSVEDRNIAVVSLAPGMAWFEFSALCEGPRSQNDYIELARSYHTLFISNIPVFTSRNEDAARRFISAIDEFYDRGVNIVVSAAAAPAALYHGERLQFEFQRAASRLIEMQTQHYLAGEHRA